MFNACGTIKASSWHRDIRDLISLLSKSTTCEQMLKSGAVNVRDVVSYRDYLQRCGAYSLLDSISGAEQNIRNVMCLLTADVGTSVATSTCSRLLKTYCGTYTGNNEYICALTYVLLANNNFPEALVGKGAASDLPDKAARKAAYCASYVKDFRDTVAMKKCLQDSIPVNWPHS